MVRETHTADQKSRGFWFVRLFNKCQEMWSGDAKDITFSNIENQRLPEQQPLQEVLVDDEQFVESTYTSDEPESVWENDGKAQPPKVEKQRNLWQRNKAKFSQTANIRKGIAYCFGFGMIAGCLLALLPVVCGNHAPGKAVYQWRPGASEVRRATMFTKLLRMVAMDDKREKGMDASVEAVHQRLPRDVRAEPPMLVKPGQPVTLPPGNGHNCSEKQCMWYYTPVNGKEICICHGRECLKNLTDIYTVDSLGRLLFNFTTGTAGLYRAYDDHRQVKLYERRISLDDSPNSGASGLHTCKPFSLLLMSLATMTLMIKHLF